MNFEIKLGAAVSLSGATGRTFEIVPSAGNVKDDETYRRGLELEKTLTNRQRASLPSPDPARSE